MGEVGYGRRVLFVCAKTSGRRGTTALYHPTKIIGKFFGAYVHSYSVEGQSLASLVVFVQSKLGCK